MEESVLEIAAHHEGKGERYGKVWGVGKEVRGSECRTKESREI